MNSGLWFLRLRRIGDAPSAIWPLSSSTPPNALPKNPGPLQFSTNAIESLNARYRRAVKARGHFPNEHAALKCLYLVTRSLDPTGKGGKRWVTRWKPALNVFATVFEGRWPSAEKY